MVTRRFTVRFRNGAPDQRTNSNTSNGLWGPFRFRGPGWPHPRVLARRPRPPGRSVAAAFNLSYEDLVPGRRRLLRRLGLHPGTDIDGYAAAALGGTGFATARRGLEALYDHYLLTEPAWGRYRMHDLIREHARALADRLDPDRDRDQATARLLDYYHHTAGLHTAGLADALLARQAGPAPAAGAMQAAVPALADREQALAWARAERASLLACLGQAAGAGQHARVIALTAGLAVLLRHDGRGPRPSPATSPPCAPRSTWVTGPPRPAPSTAWGTCG